MPHFYLRRTLIALIAPLVILSCLSSATAQAPAGPELAAIAPADAPLFLATSNLQETYNKYQKTGLGQWISSPGMQKFRESLKGTNAVSLCNLQGLFGFDDKLLAQFAAPAVVLAVPTPDGSGDIVLLIKAAAADPAVKKCLESADAYHVSRKAMKADAKAKLVGADFATSYKAAVAGGTPTEHVYFSSKGYFGIASGEQGAVLLLKNWPTAAANSLQSTPAFVAATKPLVGKSDLLWFSKPLTLTAMFEKKAGELPRGERPMSTLLKNQKFDKITGIAGQINLLTADADLQFNLFVAAKAPFEKGMRILSWKPGAKLTLPAWLPAGMAELSWVNTDPQEQFAAYGNWFDELEADGDEGTFKDIMDSMKDDPKGPMVDLEKDFWAKLQPSTLSVSDARGKPGKFNALGERSMNINEVTDPAGVQISLTKFFQNDKEVTTEKLPSGQIWWVPEGKSLFVQGSSDRLPKTTTAAIIGKYVILSDNSDLVKSLAGKPAQVPAAADPVLAPVLKRVEASETRGTAARQAVRFDEAWRASYEAMRLGKTDSADSPSVKLLKAILTGDGGEKFAKNYALLPAFADVTVYLSPGGASFDSSADGITGRGFMLKPAAR